MIYNLLALSVLMNIFLSACCYYLAKELQASEIIIDRASRVLEEDIKEVANGFIPRNDTDKPDNEEE